MSVVKLVNNTNFECHSEQTILEAARLHSTVLEHSCRTGRCGVCKAKVINGDTKVIYEEESLSDEDKSEGFILTCCRSALTDLRLDIRDLGELGNIESKTVPCKIDSLSMLSSNVVEVLLRTPPTGRLDYLPGQYVSVIGKNGLRRSYSIANAPREDGKICLHIRRVDGGKMSQYWFNEAAINDLLRLEGPLGTFFIRSSDSSNLVLLATGTGIAPIKAMLEQMSIKQEINKYKNIYLYWGGRVQADIYWQPELNNLPLIFSPILSRPSGGGRGEYVQHAVVRDNINMKDSVVYACGSEVMIYSAFQQFKALGLDEKYFYSDAFVSSN